jgi:hypothetical protein
LALPIIRERRITLRDAGAKAQIAAKATPADRRAVIKAMYEFLDDTLGRSK